jgi:shikimate kinase
MVSKPRNIVLTGFMATGKTTAGRIVADVLRLKFVDVDSEIVKHEGLSIPKIFAAKGEPEFRRIEAELCRGFSVQSGLVIATGGGALINPETLVAMREGGLVVCLWASPEVIRARLSGENGRPLAADWEAIYERRKPVYESMPHHVITSGKIPEEVAKEVVTLWRTHTQVSL